jgi:hypothetical protein
MCPLTGCAKITVEAPTMNETLLKQTQRDYAPWQRFLMLAMLAPLFIVLIPAALIRSAAPPAVTRAIALEQTAISVMLSS